MSYLKKFDQYHQLASDATGLEDFGSDTYRDAMHRYLSDLDRYGNFSELGEQVNDGMMVELLSARLMTCQGIKSNPQTQEQSITRPIFILGPARSGTTVLHRLVSADPNIQVLPYWLASAPLPKPPRDNWESHPVYRKVKKGLDDLMATMPGYTDSHPIFADRADECRYLLDQTFCSNTFCNIANVPDYEDWYIHCDLSPAFDYYHKALKLIANGDNRRWVLKDPAHLLCLDAIMETFQDACIVHTHRDPFDALASSANLAYITRRYREPSMTLAEIGKQILRLWGQGLLQMEEARKKYDDSRFLDLHMLEIRRDPLATLERIYDYFDQPVTDATRSAWEHEIKSDPNQAHSPGKFNVNDVGFDRNDVVASIGSYNERYQSLAERVL